jgi:predicted transcriptional regulator of viral defense system
MKHTHAEKSRHPRGPQEALALLHEAGIGAFFRPSDLKRTGVTRDRLRALVRAGLVEWVRRGLYRISAAEPTENHSLAMACARVPRSIVCLLSALRVHGIGTQSPADIWLAIPHKAQKPRLSEISIRFVHFSKSAWRVGVEATLFEGVPARITNTARTIADCFRFENLIGPEIPMEALQDALRQRKTTIAELARMERRFPSRRLRAALDVRSL